MIIAPTMNSSMVTEDAVTSKASTAEMCTNAPRQINRIEMDSSDESTSTVELTPYPYIPTSQELKDFRHLELSLGEDWSFRLACELSASDFTIDDDCDSACDSVSFYGNDSCDFESASLLSEDMEVCAYNHPGNFFFENVDLRVEASSL
jgi:hypothetical protein